MNANELREGNLVLELGKVHAISFKDDDHWHLENFEPIHLTPEILEAAGFVNYPEGYEDMPEIWQYKTLYLTESLQQIAFIDNKFYVSASHDPSFYGCEVNIKYVHQLQNLYFALTGSELEIKNLVEV